MKELILSFEIVIPIFLLIVLGYFLKRIKLLKHEAMETMNKLAYYVLFPVMIFNSLYTAAFNQAFNLPVIIFTVAYLAIMFVLALLIIPRLEKQNEKRSVLMQGWFRGFTLLLGFPIITGLFGADSTALLALVVVVAVPLRNVLSVITLQKYGQTKVSEKAMLMSIITNPLIISCILGLIAMSIDFKMPYIIAKPIEDVAKIGAPFALILLGGFIELGKLKGNIKQILIGVLGKLIVWPALFMAAAILLGFRGIELGVILTLVCVPIGTATFVMSQEMGGDGELAAQLTIFGTLLSIITIFAWIFVLKQFALI